MKNRHFYTAEDIESEFRRESSQVMIRVDYPLRYFSRLPKEDISEADFPELLKSVSIPKYETVTKKLRKVSRLKASWPQKKLTGNDALIRDIHAQLCEEIRRTA